MWYGVQWNLYTHLSLHLQSYRWLHLQIFWCFVFFTSYCVNCFIDQFISSFVDSFCRLTYQNKSMIKKIVTLNSNKNMIVPSLLPARFWISHCLKFAWSLERMQMHAKALFYLHIVFIRLHELAWNFNGSIKCQTFECHSNW